MTAEIVSFDLETTGLSPKSERVIEIGAVRFGQDGVTLGELQLLVDPGIPIPLPVQRLTGITSADLFGQPSPLEAMAQLAEFSDEQLSFLLDFLRQGRELQESQAGRVRAMAESAQSPRPRRARRSGQRPVA